MSVDWHRVRNYLRSCVGLRRILLPHEQGDRTILANNAAANAHFCDNVIITCVHLELDMLRDGIEYMKQLT